MSTAGWTLLCMPQSIRLWTRSFFFGGGGGRKDEGGDHLRSWECFV